MTKKNTGKYQYPVAYAALLEMKKAFKVNGDHDLNDIPVTTTIDMLNSALLELRMGKVNNLCVDNGSKRNFFPKSVPNGWTSVEFQPVCRENDGDGVSVCDEGEEDFWSVYMRDMKGHAMCIADVPDRQSASDLAALLVAAIKLKK